MIVSIDKIQRGIHDYAEGELATKATGLTKLGIYMVLPSVNKFVGSFAEKWKDNPLIEDIYTDEGIDLDVLRERALHAMEHCGSIEIAGFKFDSSDVEAIYSSILRA